MASWSDVGEVPEHTGVFLDFDGTLSHIVVDPAAAQPVAGAVDALHALADCMATVAVVSGRPARFLVEHLDLSGRNVRAFGLYGLEHTSGDGVVAHPVALEWAPVIADVAAAAEAAAPPGVGVERKGLTVALHVRPAPEHADWARRFAEVEAAERGLSVDAGRLSYELRPPVAVDKGTVVGELVRGLEVAVFIGDDRGDLLAFDAIDRFVADGGIGLKVAVRSAEAPPELLTRADEIVDGPAEVVTRLRALVTRACP